MSVDHHGSQRVLRFTVYGQARPAGSKRHIGKGRIVDANPSAKDWKRQVAQVAGEAMAGHALLDGALSLGLRFYHPRPQSHQGKRGLNATGRRLPYPATKPDCTKLVRGTEDAMKGIVFRDDAQVVSINADKLWGEPARAEIEVWEIAVEVGT